VEVLTRVIGKSTTEEGRIRLTVDPSAHAGTSIEIAL
jgi:hypothetical protein